MRRRSLALLTCTVSHISGLNRLGWSLRRHEEDYCYVYENVKSKGAIKLPDSCCLEIRIPRASRHDRWFFDIQGELFSWHPFSNT